MRRSIRLFDTEDKFLLLRVLRAASTWFVCGHSCKLEMPRTSERVVQGEKLHVFSALQWCRMETYARAAGRKSSMSASSAVIRGLLVSMRADTVLVNVFYIGVSQDETWGAANLAPCHVKLNVAPNMK